MAIESPVQNFGNKNSCMIADICYFVRRYHDGRLVFTRQLEHAADFDNKEDAETKCSELLSNSGVYLSTIEVKK